MSTNPVTPVRVHWLPSWQGAGPVQGGVAVVMDVLRATTVMVHALAAGVRGVVPCLEIEEARRVAAGMPAGSVLLGGERQGLAISGFDLGNSPGDFTAEVCRGKTLVMTTTNGTRALLSSLGAETVFVAAFVNLGATIRAVAGALAGQPPGTALHLVCAGTDGALSLEDALLAGAVWEGIRDLRGSAGFEPADDDSLVAAALWRDCRQNLATRPLAQVLRMGRGGRNLIAIGRSTDIDDAARIDLFDLAACLRRDPIRIEPVHGERLDDAAASRPHPEMRKAHA